MIYQTIYETLSLPEEQVQAIIGAGDIQSVYDRRARVALFLETNEWDEEKFLGWLKQQTVLPTAAVQAKNFVSSAATWASTGFKFVEEEQQKQRWGICLACEHLTEAKRCAQCGCFMEFKSKLAGMKCPLGKW